MSPHDIDRVLSDEPGIVPSSGFVSAVMDAVTTEATAPALPFPWRRAWPLAAGVGAALAWLIVSRFLSQAAEPGPDLYAWFEMIAPMATGWVVAGLVMSLVVTGLALRATRIDWWHPGRE